MLPVLFGENLFDELFDDAFRPMWDMDRALYGKHARAVMKTDVEAGCIIESVDGEKILAGEDYYPLFEGKVGRKMRLGIRKGGKTFEVSVRGISSGELNELLYNRWRERCRKEVERLSDGRVGYVHIRAMDSESFRHLYSELLGRFRNCEAVVIDTRHNGGGWLHDDVVTLLGGKEYQQFVPRGQYIGSDPFNKWLRPSCMLICEDNYSNACGTPWVYKELGLGKLVGTPVPGTMTAVWWETQIDPTIVFGIPVHVQNFVSQFLPDALAILIHQIIQRHQISILDIIRNRSGHPACYPGKVNTFSGSQHLVEFFRILGRSHAGDLHRRIGYIFLKLFIEQFPYLIGILLLSGASKPQLNGHRLQLLCRRLFASRFGLRCFRVRCGSFRALLCRHRLRRCTSAAPAAAHTCRSRHDRRQKQT